MKNDISKMLEKIAYFFIIGGFIGGLAAGSFINWIYTACIWVSCFIASQFTFGFAELIEQSTRTNEYLKNFTMQNQKQNINIHRNNPGT